jgi:hypothetical protein
MAMKITFVPQDCWIGLYWKTSGGYHRTLDGLMVKHHAVTFYLCLIPCLPICWTWKRHRLATSDELIMLMNQGMY